MKSTFNLKSSLRLFATGFIMGSADIVPGVSGGTIAFLMGIYEELIQGIKTVSGKVLQLGLQGKLKEAWQTIPFSFLIPLGLGLLTALLSLSNLVSYLLQAYPQYLWSLFFGLVLASVVVVRKRVVTWNIHDYAAAAVTTIAAYILVGAVPVETPNTWLALFLSGVVAICAMILPGISGSFLLVIMGKYEQVLGAITTRDIPTLVIFGLGAVVGLSIFSRLLSWLFKRHHDIIIAMLTGFMLGSLRKVWPWKEVLTTRINSHGEIVPLVEKNIIPNQLNEGFIFCVALMVIGFVIVILLDKAQITKEHTGDIDDAQFTKERTAAVRSQKSGKL